MTRNVLIASVLIALALGLVSMFAKASDDSQVIDFLKIHGQKTKICDDKKSCLMQYHYVKNDTTITMRIKI